MRICQWTVESPPSLASVIVLQLVHYILPPLMQLVIKELLDKKGGSLSVVDVLFWGVTVFCSRERQAIPYPYGNEFSPFKQLGLQYLQSLISGAHFKCHSTR